MKRPLVLLSILAMLHSSATGKEYKPTYSPLDVSDFVISIADYDIHKMTVPPSGNEVFGWSMYLGVTNMTDHTMGLNDMINDEFMYLTILHEMRHTRNDRLGVSNQESWTTEYACRDYKLFFKKDCPNQNDLEKLIRSEYK